MKKLFPTGLIFLLMNLICLYLSAQVKGVQAIGFTVSNMERSVQFYSEALGFTKVSDTELAGPEYEQLEGIFGIRMRVVRMKLGDEFIELTDYLTSGGRSIPEDAKSNDLIFQHIAIVVSDMDKAYERLRQHMVMYVSTAPQTIPASNKAAAGIRAFYFHDPDMHNLELIYFPKGKGQEKWQHNNGQLFLGIDHTAIGVSNTDKSAKFYQGLLGIERKGESWNMGMEQAHLNFVEGASLHITGFRSASGPGIEFLQYLKPGPGKAFPKDTRADDIWFWQTMLLTDNLESLYSRMQKESAQLISKSITTWKGPDGLEQKGFMVRDPDGHALVLLEAH